MTAPEPDVSVPPAVAAVLAETPTIDPVHGKTVTDFDGNLYDAEPIAARQAVAVHRLDADAAADEAQRPGYDQSAIDALNGFARFLRAEADEIAAHYRTEGDPT